MLDTEEGQNNAVYACFGSAAYHAQFFEEALTRFLTMYNRLSRKSTTVEDLEMLSQSLHKRTMGTLLNDLKCRITIHDKRVLDCFDVALRQRNYIIHEFFLLRGRELSTESGRFQLLRELVDIGNELEKATLITNGMRVAVSERLGYDQDGHPATHVKAEAKDDSAVLFTIEIDLAAPED